MEHLTPAQKAKWQSLPLQVQQRAAYPSLTSHTFDQKVAVAEREMAPFMAKPPPSPPVIVGQVQERNEATEAARTLTAAGAPLTGKSVAAQLSTPVAPAPEPVVTAEAATATPKDVTDAFEEIQSLASAKWDEQARTFDQGRLDHLVSVVGKDYSTSAYNLMAGFTERSPDSIVARYIMWRLSAPEMEAGNRRRFEDTFQRVERVARLGTGAPTPVSKGGETDASKKQEAVEVAGGKPPGPTAQVAEGEQATIPSPARAGSAPITAPETLLKNVDLPVPAVELGGQVYQGRTFKDAARKAAEAGEDVPDDLVKIQRYLFRGKVLTPQEYMDVVTKESADLTTTVGKMPKPKPAAEAPPAIPDKSAQTQRPLSRKATEATKGKMRTALEEIQLQMEIGKAPKGKTEGPSYTPKPSFVREKARELGVATATQRIFTPEELSDPAIVEKIKADTMVSEEQKASLLEHRSFRPPRRAPIELPSQKPKEQPVAETVAQTPDEPEKTSVVGRPLNESGDDLGGGVELEDITAAAKEAGVDPDTIRTTNELDPSSDNPFASGAIATVSRDGKHIIIDSAKYARSLAGLPRDTKRQILRSLLNEESIHGYAYATDPATGQRVITDEVAEAIGKGLTRPESWMLLRSYTRGVTSPPEIPARLIGHEYLRRQLQRLQRMDTTEMAYARAEGGKALFEERVLDAAESIVQYIRRNVPIGETNRAFGEAVDRLERNIKVARAVMRKEPEPEKEAAPGGQ